MHETAGQSFRPESRTRPGLTHDSVLQVLAECVSDCATLLHYEKDSAPWSPSGERHARWKMAEIRKLNESLERRVAERTAQLETVNRELAGFADAISHDLRAPLRRMNGFLGLLAEHLGPHADAQTAHCLERAKLASQRMAAYIEALLQFSRLGQQELVLEPVDLNGLVADLVEEIAGEACERRVSWKVDPLPTIRGDASLIRAVFQNLIGNALKFTRRPLDIQIHVGATAGLAGEPVVFVRDNGVGFDPAHADKLFGVFQRFHRADQFDGTGIGLANVQRIINRHGGRVWAESRPDQGATFFLAFSGGN